ncbi:MAG: hypothetical protein HOQ24_05130 [Mycobacteriaceae bacterium]|nr:hypothetical protein [Mycobacteriaceae bacterium]
MPGTLTNAPTSSTLTALDRCDRCGALARVRATLASGGELLFCQHHANQHRDQLEAAKAVIDAKTEIDADIAPTL